MLGIQTIWECPSCGNVIKSHQPFWNKKMRKGVDEPKKCACGRKENFNLMDFKRCYYEVVDEVTQLVKSEPENEKDEEL